MTITPEQRTTQNPPFFSIEFDGTNAADIVTWMTTNLGDARGLREDSGNLYIGNIGLVNAGYFEYQEITGMALIVESQVPAGSYIVIPGWGPGSAFSGIMIVDSTQIANTIIV